MSILETSRLIIEEAVLEDAPFIFKLLNSPNWIEYIGNRGIKDQDDAKAYIRDSLIGSYRSNGFGLYKVSLKSNESPIGICGLLQRDFLDHPDIGFATLPEFEGQGYTFEAAHAIVDHSIEKMGYSTILAITSPKNIKSQNLLSKLGLTKVDSLVSGNNDEVTLLYSN